MAKKKKIGIIVSVLAVVCIAVTFLAVKICAGELVFNGKISYKYKDIPNATIETFLYEKNYKDVGKIFSNKQFCDNSSIQTDFKDSVILTLNNSQIFYVSLNERGAIYWKNKDKCFKISNDDEEQLREIIIDNINSLKGVWNYE